MMNDNKVVLCGANAYEKKYYFNKEFSKIPEPMKGLPISLVAASLAALAFMGFAGMA